MKIEKISYLIISLSVIGFVLWMFWLIYCTNREHNYALNKMCAKTGCDIIEPSCQSYCYGK